MVFLSIGELLAFRTFYLRMTHYCFAGLIWRRFKLSLIFCRHAFALGRCINFDKSFVFFSTNTVGEQRERIKELLGIRKVVCFESYLGLPTMVGRSKYQTFAYLKERVWKKMQGWKGLLLSRAGKEVLIKAMA